MSMRVLLHGVHADDAPTPEDDNPNHDSNLLGLKIGAIFIVFVTTFLGTVPPLYFRTKYSHDRPLFSYFNCLSGGIFLGFGFLHIFPDAIEGFNRDVSGFPLIFFLCLCGFFGIMLVERYFIDLTSRAKSQKMSNPTVTGTDVEQNEMETIQEIPISDTDGKDKSTKLEIEEVHDHSHSHSHGHSHEFHTHEIPIHTKSPYLPYMLTLGLSFHSIFEGLALALQKNMLGLVIILIGIAIHKPAESFAMGVNFMREAVPVKKWVGLTLTFASVTPLGIILGLILLTVLSGETLELVSSILEGVAVGAFLYVGILGVIVEEFSNTRNLFLKSALFMFGILCMGLLSVLETAADE